MVKGKKLNTIKLWKVVSYRGSMLYIRQIGDELFEYLVIYDGQLFSSYIIMKPKKGRKRLTKDDKIKTAGLSFAGAVSTIDYLLDTPEDLKEKSIKPKEMTKH